MNGYGNLTEIPQERGMRHLNLTKDSENQQTRPLGGLWRYLLLSP